MPQQTQDPAATSTAAEFAQAVGRAVIGWQDIELRSAHLYVWLLDARNAQGALSSFHAVHSFNVRAMMLKTAARHLFQSPEFADLSDEFDALMDELGQCSRLRNRLTHSEVAEQLTEGGWSYSLKAPSIETAAAGFVLGGGKMRSAPEPLDFKTIKAAEGQFGAIAAALFAFEEQLRERLGSP